MDHTPDFLFIGGLREDYCITPDQRVVSGMLGGNAVYSAVGAKVWEQNVGILSRIGKNYPRSWLEELERYGVDTGQINILPEAHSSITFYAYLSLEKRVDTNPIMHFARIGKAMPHKLVGYSSSTQGQDSTTKLFPLSIRPDDLNGLNDAPLAAHLAPADFLTHNTLPYQLKKDGVKLLTIDPSLRYMTPEFRNELPKLINGIDAFLPSEMEAGSYFAPRVPSMWEMAERFSEMGCRYVVIKMGARGQLLLDREANKRWKIPAYPAKVRDVTGAGDSFCGGFLTGLARTGDPVEAALRGSVSASLTVEGTGALYALEATPGLPQSRLAALRSGVRRV